MSSGAADFEALLREALSPVEPPADLAQRLELTLVNLTELAQEELDSWELGAMRDPRNWVRPAVAAVVGVTAGTALVAAAGACAPPSPQAALEQRARPRPADPPRRGRRGPPDHPAPSLNEPAAGSPHVAVTGR